MFAPSLPSKLETIVSFLPFIIFPSQSFRNISRQSTLATSSLDVTKKLSCINKLVNSPIHWDSVDHKLILTSQSGDLAMVHYFTVLHYSWRNFYPCDIYPTFIMLISLIICGARTLLTVLKIVIYLIHILRYRNIFLASILIL